jgi:hypothetical protein
VILIKLTSPDDRVLREDNAYVTPCPELDIASQGDMGASVAISGLVNASLKDRHLADHPPRTGAFFSIAPSACLAVVWTRLPRVP